MTNEETFSSTAETGPSSLIPPPAQIHSRACIWVREGDQRPYSLQQCGEERDEKGLREEGNLMGREGRGHVGTGEVGGHEEVVKEGRWRQRGRGHSGILSQNWGR